MNTLTVYIGATERLLTSGGFWVCMVQEIFNQENIHFQNVFLP